jgi:hypothetical protein
MPFIKSLFFSVSSVALCEAILIFSFSTSLWLCVGLGPPRDGCRRIFDLTEHEHDAINAA